MDASRTRLLRILVTTLLLGLLAAAVSLYRSASWHPASKGELVAASNDGHLGLLLLGADARPGDPGRSDTMILAGVDLGQGQVRVLSIPRDTWAYIPGHGWDKINAAYAYGGVALAKRTVEQLIGFPIDHYVVISMSGFKGIVDALGGVTIDVEEDMNYDDPYDTPPLHIHLKKGLQHLDGTQALGYVRYRHDAQGDFGRMRRQQKFLVALMRQALLPQNWSRIPDLIRAFRGAVQTDVSVPDAIRLAYVLHGKVQPGSLQGETLSDQHGGRDVWIDGVYYFAVEVVQLRTLAYRTVFGTDPPADFLAEAQSYAREYDGSIGAALRPRHQSLPASRESRPQTATYSVVLVDASGADLLATYAQRLQAAGFRVVRLVPHAQPIAHSAVILPTSLADAQTRLKALLPHAQFVEVQGTAQEAEAPIQVFLGQDLVPTSGASQGSPGTPPPPSSSGRPGG